MVVRRLFGAKVENNQEFSKFEGLEHKKNFAKATSRAGKNFGKVCDFSGFISFNIIPVSILPFLNIKMFPHSVSHFLIDFP